MLSSLKIASKKCPNYLKNHLQVVAEVLLTNLHYAPKEIDAQGLYLGLCNNAASALGDVAMAFPESFQSYIPTFAEKLCEILGKKVQFLLFELFNLLSCIKDWLKQLLQLWVSLVLSILMLWLLI